VAVSTTGIINAGGGGAHDGITYHSGAGSGGSILIEAPMVLIAGKVAANAGSGSGADQAGLDATTDAAPTMGAGGGAGTGGGGDQPDGTTGAVDADGRVRASAGGGAGRIRINTANASATVSGTISPTFATPCATQGSLSR
jgi:hypothetical protein